jgi:uncharacterized protein (DUF362 family)
MRERKVQKPIVAIARSNQEQASLQEALNLLPVRDVIHSGDRVVITPNWVTAKSPETAATVGTETLRALIQLIKEYQPKEIIVATGSGEDTVKVFHQVGYDKIIEEEKISFVDLNYGPYIEMNLEHDIVPKTKVNQLIDQMDVLISFTQLKQHEEATVSACVKNILMGWPPAEIHGFPKKNLGIHKDLHGFIAAMAKKLPIDLAILSADKTMIGTGPNHGIAVDTKGLLIASTDAVAADTIGARMLGFLPQAVHYLYLLGQCGYGETDVNKMIMQGLPLKEAEKIFSMAAYGKEIVL